jgi:hypothetical protein
MMRLVGWIVTLILLMFLVWQTAVENALWFRAFTAILLLILSLLAGIRIGADSAAAYIKDLQRINKAVIEQNSQLQQANETLLKELAADLTAPTQHS